MAILEARYLEVPFCELYIQERGGSPMLSTSKETLDLLHCQINLDATKIDTASIIVQMSPDVVDLELNGVHEGTTVFIRMGYKDVIFPPPFPPFDRVVFSGILERPKVQHTHDGNIRVDLRARAMAVKAHLALKTVNHLPLTRGAIIAFLFSPYIGTVINPPVIVFSTMTKMEKTLKQINRSDFGFLTDLAKKWNCILHQTSILNKTNVFFVDNNDEGRALIDAGALQPLGYEFNWRRGGTLKPANVKRIDFSGLAGAKKTNFVIELDPITGKPSAGKVVVGTGDDASTWALNEAKVSTYIEENGIVKFSGLVRNAPQQEIRDTFWEKVKDVESAHPAHKGASPVKPTLGYLGHKADFQLAQGDAMLEPNMTGVMGGDIMDRFKKFKWRIMKVQHVWSSEGFHTSGTLGA